MSSAFFESVLSLVVRTSTDLPPDVRAAMKAAMNQEDAGRAAQALEIIALNVDQAAEGEGAICQDTGMPTFEVKTPVGANQIVMKKEIRAAIAAHIAFLPNCCARSTSTWIMRKVVVSVWAGSISPARS